MKLLIKPITVEMVYKFVYETKLLYSYHHELSLAGAYERISFFL